VRLRRRLRTRRNPKWSWDYLDDHWANLKRRIPPQFMPVEEADPAKAETVRLVRSSARASARANPRVAEYGSGHFGVAMPTHNPRWICKITRDESEALLVNALRVLGLGCKLKGLARCSPVYAMDSFTYIFWRESATVAGDDVWGYLADRSSRERAVRLTNKVFNAVDRLRNGWDDPDERDAAYRSLESAPELEAAGHDLRMLASHGIYPTDIHEGNWGILPRRPGQASLLDPGNVEWDVAAYRFARAKIPLL
jgi:hypothetical protein